MKNIVVIAHDAKKPELARFLKEREEWVQGVSFVATGRTAEYIEDKGITVKHMSPGRSGGYNQITRMIENKEVDIVIFFRDPIVKEQYHEDIQRLLDACDNLVIPLATNYASAELLILGLIRKETAEKFKMND
ncbi:MAG: methylglyoxal synthase [Bacteroidia bacterium]|nr:methylglyoxal synthase [Bacteroidia bacterium]